MAIGLSACGAKTTSNSSTTPRGTLPPLGGGQLAECTRVAPNNMYFNGQLASYYYNGSSNNEFIQMNITSVPAEFYSEGYSAQVFRFREPTSGARQYNQLPSRMYFVNKLTGSFASNTPVDTLSREVFQTMITNNGLEPLNITATNFIDNYYVLLTGMELQWEAVEVRLFNSGQVVTSASSLLPPFFADPNVYASRIPVPALHALHPLMTMAGTGASEAEFKRLADEICTSFFGTVRNTASVEDVEPQSFMGWVKYVWNKVLAWF